MVLLKEDVGQKKAEMVLLQTELDRAHQLHHETVTSMEGEVKSMKSKAAAEAKDAEAKDAEESNAKAAAELGYKCKIAEDLAKQKTKEAAMHAEQAEAERALAVAEQQTAAKHKAEWRGGGQGGKLRRR